MKIGVKVRANSESNKDIICRSLGINEFEYRRFRRDEAYVWLANRFRDAELEDAIGMIPLFWKWWNSQWETRDAEYVKLSNVAEINEVLTGRTKQSALELYNEIHNSDEFKVVPNIWLNIEINKVIEFIIVKNTRG